MKRKVSFWPGMIMMLLSLLLNSSVVIARRTIRGTVTDAADGLPLPAVSVVVRGATAGTSTQADGTYTLNVPLGSNEIIVSMVGYVSQTLSIGSGDVIDVILAQETTVFDEIVVTGYSAQSRAEMTTSISKLDTRVLENAPRSNVATALQGTIAGLKVTQTSGQPGTTPSLVVRGGTSFDGTGNTLYYKDKFVRYNLEQRLSGSVHLDYKFLNDFTFTLRGSHFSVNNTNESFNKAYLNSGSLITARNASASPDGSFSDSFEGRLLNPGHAIEAMWFMIDLAERRGDPDLARRAVEITLRTLDKGWDREFGGIFYFLDVKGYPPQQLEWDQKLWWVHIETLISLAKGYRMTGDERCLDWFEKVDSYTWRHFPDPDYGEWYGYLNRRGGRWPALGGCFAELHGPPDAVNHEECNDG